MESKLLYLLLVYCEAIFGNTIEKQTWNIS
jgi:hypothetical protein